MARDIIEEFGLEEILGPSVAPDASQSMPSQTPAQEFDNDVLGELLRPMNPTQQFMKRGAQAADEAWDVAKQVPGHAWETVKGVGSGLYDIAGGNDYPGGIQERMQMPFAEQLKQAFGMSQPENAYTPERAARAGAAGLMSGGRGALNAMLKLYGKAKEHPLAPSGMPDINLPENVQNADYYSLMGIEDQRPGDALIGGAAEQLPGYALTGNPYAGAAMTAYGQDRNPVLDVATMALLHGASKGIGKGVDFAEALAKGEVEFPKLGRALKKIPEEALPERFSQAKTVDRLASDYGAEFAERKAAINDVLRNPAVDENLYYAPNPEQLKTFRKRGGGAYTDNLDRFLKTQSLEDAFWAQSDLGKFVRLVEEKQSKAKATPAKGEAARAAKAMRAELKDLIKDALQNSENPALVDQFNAATNDYRLFKEKYHPSIEVDIQKYSEGKIAPNDVLKTIRSKTGREFRHQYGEQYPGLSSAKYPEAWKNLVSQVPVSGKLFEYLGREVKK